MSTPIAEELLIYIGQLACLSASIYMIKVGEVKIGVLFLIAFILQIQSSYLIQVIGYDAESQGECWAKVGSYYECLPIVQRVSIHLAQVGTVMLAIAVFLSARKFRKKAV